MLKKLITLITFALISSSLYAINLYDDGEGTTFDLNGRVVLHKNNIDDFDNRINMEEANFSRITLSGERVINETFSTYGLVEWSYSPLSKGDQNLGNRLGYLGFKTKNHDLQIGRTYTSYYNDVAWFTDQFWNFGIEATGIIESDNYDVHGTLRTNAFRYTGKFNKLQIGLTYLPNQSFDRTKSVSYYTLTADKTGVVSGDNLDVIGVSGAKRAVSKGGDLLTGDVISNTEWDKLNKEALDSIGKDYYVTQGADVASQVERDWGYAASLAYDVNDTLKLGVAVQHVRITYQEEQPLFTVLGFINEGEKVTVSALASFQQHVTAIDSTGLGLEGYLGVDYGFNGSKVYIGFNYLQVEGDGVARENIDASAQSKVNKLIVGGDIRFVPGYNFVLYTEYGLDLRTEGDRTSWNSSESKLEVAERDHGLALGLRYSF